jgi:hypothetical protein
LNFDVEKIGWRWQIGKANKPDKIIVGLPSRELEIMMTNRMAGGK